MDPTPHPAMRALDAFVPARLRARGPLVVRRARIVLGAACIGFAAQAWTFVAQGVRGTPEFAVAAGLGAACMVAIPPLLRLSGSLTAAGHAFTAVLFAVGASTMALSGGHGAMPAFHLGLVPMAAVLLVGRRAGAAWLGATVAFVALLGWAVFAERFDHPVRPDPELVHLSLLRGAVVLAFVCFGIALVYESLKDRALREMTAAQVLAEREHRARLDEEIRFRALIERSEDALLIVGRDGRSVYRSAAVERIRGPAPPGRPATRTIFDAVHAADRAEVEAMFARCRAVPGVAVPFRCRLHHHGGGYVHVEGTGLNLLDDAAVRGVVVSYRDVTARVRAEAERRSLEQRAQEGERLKSLGVLAGGIAHDFNNLLVTIQGKAQLVLAEDGLAANAREMLEDVEGAARRAADLTHQLLAYAGKGRVEPQIVALSELADEVVRLVRGRLPQGAALRVEHDGEAPWIHADVGQVHQVVMNLVTNAVEALGEEEGEIVVRTGTMRLDAEARVRLRLPGPHPDVPFSFVEIRDTGCGMSPGTLERIFEPFYTTKFRGRGLGLAALLGIVRSHEGNLWVESEPGKGSVFRVLLPRVAVPAAVERPARPAPGGGAGVVLVVDDEPSVRQVTVRMLQRAGFETVACRGGAEALERVAEREGELAGVVLDLEMPGMDGTQTFQALRRRWPDLPVLFMSGHGEADLAARLGDARRVAYLSKPFAAADLAAHLRRLTDD